ncbi:MAG: hypothetical protein H0U73_06040, partial [Tatlockia sp.]|nr:hypothetical protein [Tatlockia sp.]
MKTKNDHKDNKLEIDNTEMEKLLWAGDSSDYNEKCFAMLHCTSAIRNSQWEGGQSLIALKFIQELVNKAKPLINSGLTENQCDAINSAFNEVVFFHNLFQSCKITETGELNIDLKAITSEIASRCEKKGYCYLPSGWTGDKSGHFAILKLQSRGPYYAASILNLGAGVEFHRPLSQGKHKLKRDYQSYEYEINLDSSLGKFFLSELIYLFVDRRPYDINELEVRQE